MASQEMLSIEDVQGILSLPLLGIVLEDEQVIISTNRGEPLTLTDGRSPAKKCYLNVSQRLTNKDVPIIDPKKEGKSCLLYTSPSPRDISGSRMPSSA